MEKLDTYQEQGVDFLAGNFRGFLYDDMGLGKSAQAIRAADAVGAEKILVVCPAAARINWGREFRKFQLHDRSISLVMSSSQVLDRAADVTIVNYDLIHKRAILNQLLIRQWDIVVLDESQYLKEPDAARTMAVYGPRCDGEFGIVDNGFYVWPLSGTPSPNNPLELWASLYALTPQAILYQGKPLTWYQFLCRYCVWDTDKYGKTVVRRGRNLKELRARMRPFMLRRLKKDVLKDLPPLRVAEWALDVQESFAHVLKLEQHPELQYAIDRLKSGASPEDLLASLPSEYVATLRRVTSLVKAKAVAELMRTELAAGLDKIVLMAWHRQAIEILFEELNAAGYKTVRLWGGMSPKDAQSAIDAFQDDPEVRVFVGQITSAGTAITLTAASQMMFVEMAWSPKTNEQARDRVYRRGQKNPVLIRCAYLPGSIDEAVTAVLRRKLSDINELLGDENG